jgi:hypothetical protein
MQRTSNAPLMQLSTRVMFLMLHRVDCRLSLASGFFVQGRQICFEVGSREWGYSFYPLAR